MRLILLLIVLTFGPGALLAADPALKRQAMSAAMVAIRQNNFTAARFAALPAGRVAQDVVEWHRLRRGDAVFADYARFVERNPDWPGLARLREAADSALPVGGPPQQVLDWFGDRLPQTSAGLLRLIEAHRALDEEDRKSVV